MDFIRVIILICVIPCFIVVPAAKTEVKDSPEIHNTILLAENEEGIIFEKLTHNVVKGDFGKIKFSSEKKDTGYFLVRVELPENRVLIGKIDYSKEKVTVNLRERGEEVPLNEPNTDDIIRLYRALYSEESYFGHDYHESSNDETALQALNGVLAWAGQFPPGMYVTIPEERDIDE